MCALICDMGDMYAFPWRSTIWMGSFQRENCNAGMGVIRASLGGFAARLCAVSIIGSSLDFQRVVVFHENFE